MTRRRDCPECGSTDLLVRDGIATRGAYGPDLLPGGGAWIVPGKMTAVLCRACGLIRYFAGPEALRRIGRGNGWRRIGTAGDG